MSSADVMIESCLGTQPWERAVATKVLIIVSDIGVSDFVMFGKWQIPDNVKKKKKKTNPEDCLKSKGKVECFHMLTLLQKT